MHMPYLHVPRRCTKTNKQRAFAVMVHVHSAFVLLSVCADVCEYHCSLQLQNMRCANLSLHNSVS